MEILQGASNSHGVTKENLQLKILEVKGASCVGDPCNSIRGPHLASPAPNKPVAKAMMLTSWQHHMDSVAERSKAVAQGAIPQGRGFEPHHCHSYTSNR